MGGRFTISAVNQVLAKARMPALAALVCLMDVPAHAQRVENGMAIFAALDKVTAAVQKVTAKLNDTEPFRTLRITPRACYTSPPTEPPRTSTFVEIDEIMFDGKEKRIFSGWMFAESPGLNPLLHPVFDVWLTSCSEPQGGAPSAKGPQAGTGSGPPAAAEPQRRRRAPR
jgi:hypothetical protein